jgi:hypothetical protein
VEDPNRLDWSGEEVLFSQARISDQVAQQRSQKWIFVAGVLGGIGGGFLVEGLSKIRLGQSDGDRRDA